MHIEWEDLLSDDIFEIKLLLILVSCIAFELVAKRLIGGHDIHGLLKALDVARFD